jgi:hypothetical protein
MADAWSAAALEGGGGDKIGKIRAPGGQVQIAQCRRHIYAVAVRRGTSHRHRQRFAPGTVAPGTNRTRTRESKQPCIDPKSPRPNEIADLRPSPLQHMITKQIPTA